LALIAASQYLLFWLTFSDHQLSKVFYDVKLHCIVAASLFSVAAAFIINAFYDVDKDLVNKPKQVVIGKLLGESSLLNLYVVLNFFAVGFAMMASIRVMVFFVCYTVFCWFHSHKLQKMPVIREISASLLTMIPLIAIWFHFGHWHWGMFYYIGSLAILLFTREVVKDMAGHKGNLIFGYQTVVVVAGVKTARWGLVAMNTGFFVMYWALNWIQMVDPVLPNWHPDYYLIISGVSLFTAFWVSWAMFFIRDDSNNVFF
jgi:4-hydroxybenzoate polyprenyltransferase